MRRIYYPVLLKNLSQDRASTFVTLFSLEALTRALMLTVVPLEAYRLFDSAFLVSLVYFSTSAIGLIFTIVLPAVIHRITRRWAVTCGALSYVGAAVLYSIGEPAALVAGLTLQVIGVTALEIVLNLYVLDHVPRKELNSFEPRRMFYAGMAFIAGPLVGVYLQNNLFPGATFLLVAALALTSLAYFWILRLSDDETFQAAKKPPPKPIRFVPRFAAQPRLILAWLLAVGRTSWWIMYFVYMPIQISASGFSQELTGAIVSLGLAPMFLVRVWAKIGKKKGIRPLLIAGYGLSGIATMVAALSTGSPEVAIVMLLLGALSATIVDGAGNVPFLRAVHPYERESMTSVYMTFRHTASLGTPGIFAIILAFLPLQAVFAASAAIALSMAALSRFIPRKL